MPSEDDRCICSGEAAFIDRLAEYLNYSDITAMVRSEETEERAMLFVSAKQEEIAKRAVRIFMIEDQERIKAKAEDALDSMETDTVKTEDEALEEEYGADYQDKQPSVKRQSMAIYKNRADQAEEFKSSGMVLLVVGVLGIICMVLIDLGILPFKLNNLVMMNIMMNLLFLIFIIFGINSLRGAKKYAGEAEAEKNLTKEIKMWANENLRAEEVDIKSGCQEDEAEEIAYFKRYEYLKKTISEKFINLEDSYLDYLTESIYQNLYEEQEET